jgi:hypothetical protein
LTQRSFGGRPARVPRKAIPVGLVAVAATALAISQAGAAVAAPVAANSSSAAQATLTSSQAAALSTNVSRHVIVFLKDEPSIVSPARSALATRSSQIASSQAGLVSELSQVHATNVTAYRLVNAVAATVSPAEETRLKANPQVAQVIPDALIQGPSASAEQPDAAAKTAKIKPLPGACLPHGKVELEPEALQVTGVQSQSKTAKTARSLGFTGSGVKVAYMADGIDTTNVNFIRANGKSVFTDYKDFTGDGTGVPSGAGGEAFLDANSIAGQGRHTYNVQNFGTHKLTEPCNIRIEGVAPGVTLEGLRVYGFNNYGTTSGFLDAINYATVVDPVNVLNESFGGNEIPDTSVDAVKEFDDAAVAAGVTVVVSSGDAAPDTDTIGSPATDPNVIGVGASTDFRAYAMSDYLNADTFARTGWLNDNISEISSSGFDETGGGVDLVAPGDSSFTSCQPNLANFPDCTNLAGKASAVQLTGGTSQSSPLTAGTAALVIQAYRKTHAGATPSPSLVKQIITSTATDVHAAGQDQGAGLLNAYKAVQLAESIGKGHHGSTLLTTVASPAGSRPGQIDVQGLPSTATSTLVKVTNEGTSTQTVHLSGRALGAPEHAQTGSVILSQSKSKHLVNNEGNGDDYDLVHFNVSRGQNRLNATIAYPFTQAQDNWCFVLGNPCGAAVELELISPSGKLAATSLPQGLAETGSVIVTNPQRGRWTMVLSSPFSHGALRGADGRVHWSVSTQKFARFGSVSKSSMKLTPGQTRSFTFAVSTPHSAGDADGSVVVSSPGGTSTIPVLLRSYVRAGASGGGSFSGSQNGGNGRGPGQFAYYQFRVGSGNPDISASVKLANDDFNLVDTFLVNPQGQVEGSGSNEYVNSSNSISEGLTAASFAVNAQPGTWTLLVNFADAVGGDKTANAYSGHISLTAGASASGVPTGTIAPAGQTFPVVVTNHGSTPEDFFLDPRLTGAQVSYALVQPSGGVSSTQVPMPITSQPLVTPDWLVPTESSSVTASATVAPIPPASTTTPIAFDFGPYLGDPDVPSFTPATAAGSTTPSATESSVTGPITPGLWNVNPAPAAPDGFTSADTTPETATFSASVQTQPFDSTVASDVGDLWQEAVDASAQFGILTIAPGKSATIQVTVTPTGPAGSVVSGTLYVDDFTYIQLPATDPVGSELAAIPYSYTVGS